MFDLSSIKNALPTLFPEQEASFGNTLLQNAEIAQTSDDIQLSINYIAQEINRRNSFFYGLGVAIGRFLGFRKDNDLIPQINKIKFPPEEHNQKKIYLAAVKEIANPWKINPEINEAIDAITDKLQNVKLSIVEIQPYIPSFSSQYIAKKNIVLLKALIKNINPHSTLFWNHIPNRYIHVKPFPFIFNTIPNDNNLLLNLVNAVLMTENTQLLQDLIQKTAYSGQCNEDCLHYLTQQISNNFLPEMIDIINQHFGCDRASFYMTDNNDALERMINNCYDIMKNNLKPKIIAKKLIDNYFDQIFRSKSIIDSKALQKLLPDEKERTQLYNELWFKDKVGLTLIVVFLSMLTLSLIIKPSENQPKKKACLKDIEKMMDKYTENLNSWLPSWATSCYAKTNTILGETLITIEKHLNDLEVEVHENDSYLIDEFKKYFSVVKLFALDTQQQIKEIERIQRTNADPIYYPIEENEVNIPLHTENCHGRAKETIETILSQFKIAFTESEKHEFSNEFFKYAGTNGTCIEGRNNAMLYWLKSEIEFKESNITFHKLLEYSVKELEHAGHERDEITYNQIMDIMKKHLGKTMPLGPADYERMVTVTITPEFLDSKLGEMGYEPPENQNRYNLRQRHS